MTFARSQQGLSLLSWLVVLVVVAVIGGAGLKMAPHYFDYMALEKTIKGLESDRLESVRTVGDVYDRIATAMQTNNIRDLNVRDVVQVTLEGNSFLVHLKYEKREPLIANLDLVANFDQEFRVRMP